MEQFDEVAGWVGEQDLAAARAGDRVTAERYVGAAQPCDLRVEVVDDEVDAIAARARGVGGCGAGAGACGSGKQEAQRPADHVGEGGCDVGVELEAEVRRVEVDGRLDVVDKVADAGVLVGGGHGWNLLGYERFAARTCSRCRIRVSMPAAVRVKVG